MGKRSEEIEEARSAINAFVKSKGQVRESGFKEADAGIFDPGRNSCSTGETRGYCRPEKLREKCKCQQCVWEIPGN
ncbi:hypothetical protein [Mediterraneibacter gnavus]|uniref:hypothetical protein n=1 Tax=Mediterraneibacter gnavus TaxID=33038 RepID=UPI001A9865BC|nr:hypothetical protein [Mediterraneibacter gnavus]